ncbi:MAG TPA: dicarboxylate/amino acid:cation symporter [Vicinamibacterales bacterium]|nr:dicarboxylate/amino acid:cation symporter [Vicinamibacterales bacterium]
MSQPHDPSRPRLRVPTLYAQVLVGIAAGVALGFLRPDYAVAMKPFGDGFIKLVRMLITPIVFTTVVVGIAQTGAMKEIGRIGLRALLYFEVVSSAALVIGLIVVHALKPGAGLAFNPSTVDLTAVAAYTSGAKHLNAVDFILNIVPDTFFGPFSGGDILQTLLVSILCGVAMLRLGSVARPLVDFFTVASKVLFGIVDIIMRLAPLGAFGAMSFTVGKYGIGSLLSLGKLMAGVYLTCVLFVFVVLGTIAALVGFNLIKFLRYIADDILIVLGTSSSESVLPRIMEKMEHLGCSRSVVGLVIPTGYSFNLDGTSIYMTMAALFIAQASHVQLSLAQQLGILAILMLTSKGAAAVTGGGFITLAATLSAFPSIPVAGLTLLLGVDRFMSEARAITNLIGNAVATMVIARWNGALDLERARRILDGKPADADEPVAAA